MSALHAAVDGGAWLLLGGDRGDLAGARRHLGALLGPVIAGEAIEWGSSEAALVADEAGFESLAARGGRGLGGVLALSLRADARVGLRVRDPRGGWHPLIAGWRVDGRRVVWWGGGAFGPWGAGLREHPDTLARWWDAVVAFARSL